MKIKVILMLYAIFLIFYTILVIKIHDTIKLECVEDNPGCQIKTGFAK